MNPNFSRPNALDEEVKKCLKTVEMSDE